MISSFDDYPIHQTPDVLALPATSDRNFYDRYWMNGFANTADYYFGVSMGRYPHLDVIDAGFSIVLDGTQHSINISGRAPKDPSETRVGPFRIEIVEPMRQLRLTIDDDEISVDLLFTADTAPLDEGRQRLSRGTRTFYDVTRFAQYGSWAGEIRVADQTIILRSKDSRGTKDRSWGIRPVGAPETPGAPSNTPPQFYFLWAPIHWEDRCSHIGIFEDAFGKQLHANAALVSKRQQGEFPDGNTANSVERELRYMSGTRRMTEAEFTITFEDGSRTMMELEPQLLFAMKGLGYGHPQWRHGMWRGELNIAHDHWQLNDLDPLAIENLHIQQLVLARSGNEVGMGALEQLCIGAHTPSGFSNLADGAL